jgi:hypothetical protein
MLLRLDYLSCVLTVLSTVLVGRRKWQGWLVAGANSAIISLIGLRTGQWGFIPANAFCIAIYLYNIRKWRTASDDAHESQNAGSSARLMQQETKRAAMAIQKLRIACRRSGKHAGDERATSYRIRARRIPNQRESRTPF